MPILDLFWFPKIWPKPKRYVARMLACIRHAKRQNPWWPEKNKVDPTFQWAKTARPQGDMGQNFLES